MTHPEMPSNQEQTVNAIVGDHVDDQLNPQGEETKKAAAHLIEAYAKAMVIQNILDQQGIASEN